MRDYTVTTMMRFIRVTLKTCVTLLEIGISNDIVFEIIELLSKDIMRVLQERKE